MCLTLQPWTVAYQAPLSMGFSRQKYCSWLPFPSPGYLADPGIEPRSPALQADALTSEPPGKTISGFPSKGFPGGSMVKNLPAKARDAGDVGSMPGSGRSPGEGNGYSSLNTPVFLPGESHGRRSLVSYSPWGHKEWDITEHACVRTHTHIPGEGSGF